MIRTGAGMPITRFAALIGVPRRTYQHRLAKHRAGDPPKGPWPAPVVDRIEPAVAKLAAEWPAWGHRKIWAMGRHAGWEFGSQSSVRRAMARRGLLQPVRYQAERRQLAKARRAVFADVPSRPNRVWQADFSEFETGTEGTWQLGGVVDYVTKLVLACPVSATQTAGDLCAAFDAAETRASELLGHRLVEDCTDDDTGEIDPDRDRDRQRPGHEISGRRPLVRRPLPLLARKNQAPVAAHKRSDRTLVRSIEIRTALPPRHRRRHRPRRPRRRLHRRIQPNPTPREPRLGPPPRRTPANPRHSNRNPRNLSNKLDTGQNSSTTATDGNPHPHLSTDPLSAVLTRASQGPRAEAPTRPRRDRPRPQRHHRRRESCAPCGSLRPNRDGT